MLSKLYVRVLTGDSAQPVRKVYETYRNRFIVDIHTVSLIKCTYCKSQWKSVYETYSSTKWSIYCLGFSLKIAEFSHCCHRLCHFQCQAVSHRSRPGSVSPDIGTWWNRAPGLTHGHASWCCTWQTKKVRERERACGFCCALKTSQKCTKKRPNNPNRRDETFSCFIRKNSIENPRITFVAFEPDRNGISLRAHLVTAGVRYSHHCGLRFDRHRSFCSGKKTGFKKSRSEKCHKKCWGNSCEVVVRCF